VSIVKFFRFVPADATNEQQNTRGQVFPRFVPLAAGFAASVFCLTTSIRRALVAKAATSGTKKVDPIRKRIPRFVPLAAGFAASVFCLTTPIRRAQVAKAATKLRRRTRHSTTPT
jgi:hypothetical protein